MKDKEQKALKVAFDYRIRPTREVEKFWPSTIRLMINNLILRHQKMRAFKAE
jgi:hypothetical protein